MVLFLLACTGPEPGVPSPTPTASAPFTVVTFNTGTSENMGHDALPDDGYTGAHALISDMYYGDGLAWLPAVEATTAWFAAVQPDIVGFQEIFHAEECEAVPPEGEPDFFCSTWSTGQPTVASVVLGPDYQVLCHPGKSDKCAAVHRNFGSFRGCDGDFCLEGLDGGQVDGCGSGSRVGRGVIERTDGSLLTVVNVHGSSGLAGEDQDCRAAQVDQVFVDLDGEPAVNGAANVVFGDLNTDPGRWADFDPSAARWNDFVGDGKDFAWISEVGPDAPLSYQGLSDIDHVASDTYTGDCWIGGLSEGHDAVIDAVYFDHRPVVCTLGAP